MGQFVKGQLPCVVDGCGSSDAAALYKDEKTNERYMLCFSATCPKRGKATFMKDDWSDVKDDTFEEGEPEDDPRVKDTVEMKPPKDEKLYFTEYSKAKPSKAKADRALTQEALENYGVREAGNLTLFPYFKGQDMVGIKRRTKDKKFDTKGAVNGKLLFGQQAFKPGGKYLTVHSGEYDAIAGYQMTGNKYANVSIPCGDVSALEACKANYDWMNTFQEVVFSFDADESGQKAIEECCALFPGKSAVITMDKSLKDANGYLIAGKTAEYTAAFWAKKSHVPDGIVAGNELWERINATVAEPVCPWPYTVLNEMLYGIYPRRLYTFTAGSGVGKTQLIRELTYHILTKTDLRIGILMLEEAVEESARGFMSLYLNKPLHVPTTLVTQEEKREAFDATHGLHNRVFYHDHFGSTTTSNILDRVSYLIRVMGCKLIVLDHLSIIISAQQNGDERKAIDEIMTKLRMLVQATGATLFLISHLSRRPGKDYTEGAQVSTSDLRGSASIEQLSDVIIACERNGQHKDPRIANTTLLRVLKSRSFGRLGLADALYYDHDTGRMVETEMPSEDDDGEVEDTL